MVTVNFKLSDTAPVILEITGPVALVEILEMCRARLDEDFGSVIAIRQGKVLAGHNHIGPDDTIDVFPAISGG